VIYHRHRGLRLPLPGHHSDLGVEWRRTVPAGGWQRGSWRCRSACRSVGWSHQLGSEPQHRRCLEASESVSIGFSACLDTIEVDEARTHRYVPAGQTILLTGAQGSSFFRLPPHINLQVANPAPTLLRTQLVQAERVQTSVPVQRNPAQAVQDSAQIAEGDADLASVTTQPVETVTAVLAASREGVSINAAAKASGINYRTAQRIVHAGADHRQRQLAVVS
jgi:hypothetical protein